MVAYPHSHPYGASRPTPPLALQFHLRRKRDPPLSLPLFTIFAAIPAYRCYATDRKPMAWILLVLSVLSSVAIEFV